MSWDNLDDTEYDMESAMEEISDGDLQIEESLQHLLESQQEVMESAKIRLAQGRLYEMLLKHELFDDSLGEDPRAIKKVQAEVRAFVTERLEIMLGMRQTASKNSQPQIQSVTVQLPFNEVEIDALKAIANKLSKGQSEGLENLEIEAKIDLAEAPKDRQDRRTVQRPVPPPPVVRKPVSPITNKKPLDRKAIEKTEKTGKELHKMSQAELEEYASKRTLLPKVGKPSGVQPLPMPEPAMIDMMMAEAADRNASGGNAVGSFTGAASSTNPNMSGFNSWVSTNLRGAVPLEDRSRR